MRSILLATALAALLTSTAPAAASVANGGYITNSIVQANGVVLFNLTGSRTTDLPGCATPNQTRWALDASTPAGQVRAAHLFTAYALQKRVVIQGRGNCDAWGDTETVEYLTIID